MQKESILVELGIKISLLLEKYNNIKDENIILSEELTTLKKIVEEQKEEIIKLQEEEELRTMEIEEITQKIMKLLS